MKFMLFFTFYARWESYLALKKSKCVSPGNEVYEACIKTGSRLVCQATL